MRIREGKYAYDLEQPPDPLTQVRTKWRYRIFRVDPIEKVLSSGEADTLEEAEKRAREAIAALKDAPEQPAA
ncbi:MAG TPA: hypothetical protein VFA68_17575 [Terriglobales bacterium]|nr:hypothetical protein [Terriglobales bacterium]